MNTNVHALESAHGFDLRGAAKRVFGGAVAILATIPAATRAAREIERLNILSEGELARLGVRREEIARYAMERHMHI